MKAALLWRVPDFGPGARRCESLENAATVA
jgi:hypothetical protein